MNLVQFMIALWVTILAVQFLYYAWKDARK